MKNRMPNDGNAPEVIFSTRDEFHIFTFYAIVENIETEHLFRFHKLVFAEKSKNLTDVETFRRFAEQWAVHHHNCFSASYLFLKIRKLTLKPSNCKERFCPSHFRCLKPNNTHLTEVLGPPPQICGIGKLSMHDQG